MCRWGSQCDHIERHQWNARQFCCSPSCLTIFTFFLPAPAAGGAASSSSQQQQSGQQSRQHGARYTAAPANRGLILHPWLRAHAAALLAPLWAVALPTAQGPVTSMEALLSFHGCPILSYNDQSHGVLEIAPVYRAHIFVRYRIWVRSQANPKAAHYLAE